METMLLSSSETKNVTTVVSEPDADDMCVFCSRSAQGGGEDGVLSGSGLRSVLAASPPQPNPETHHLRWKRSEPLRAAQVRQHIIQLHEINMTTWNIFVCLVTVSAFSWCWTTSASTWPPSTPASTPLHSIWSASASRAASGWESSSSQLAYF